MEIRGLCLLAASRAAKLPALGAVWALMPDTSRLTSGKYDPHAAVLMVAKNDADKFDAPDSEKDGELIYRLTHHDVRLMFDGAVPTGPVMTEAKVPREDKTKKLSYCPPYDAPWSDVAFVADLDGLLGVGEGTIAGDYIKPKLDDASKVAARVFLASGKLLGAAPVDPWGRHVRWGINDSVPGIEYGQALTDTVEYLAPSASKLEIVVTNRTDNSQRKVQLKTTKVRVKVHNMATGLNGCEDKSPKKKAKKHDDSCRPHHFRAYYELLEKDPGHYPHPGAMFLCENGFELKNSDPPFYCPPPFAFYN